MNKLILALTLAYFGLNGPVSEVTQYGLFNYDKKVYRFDVQGRLIEYEEFGHPFADSGSCVYRRVAHYKYGYGNNDSLRVLYAFNEDNKLDATVGDTVVFHHIRKGDDNNYHASQYDAYGNWTERVVAGEDDHTRPGITVRHISYYRDVELMGLSVGVKTVTHRNMTDGQLWWNCYSFDRDGGLVRFQSFVDTTALYEWNRGDSADADVQAHSLITIDTTSARSITYWEPRYEVESITELPDGCNQESAFDLMFKYKGYLFTGDLYPLHNNHWIVLSHWCLNEEETIFVEDENGEEIPAKSVYKDPFKGIRYPVITTDSISFATRNYGKQTINFYKTAQGSKVQGTIGFECELWVTDADVKSRRVNCHTNPNDSMWGEPQNEEERDWKHPFKDVNGWVEEKWICSNPLTTCP